MIKHKTELLLLIIVIPIIAYIGFQAYNSYFKSLKIDISQSERLKIDRPGSTRLPDTKIVEPRDTQKRETIAPETAPETKDTHPAQTTAAEEELTAAEPKGVLDSEGYSERDPLKHSLPVVEKVEKPPEPLPFETKPEEKSPAENPPKEIILPTFVVSGTVWGEPYSRAIIDNAVYAEGDIVKGAKILNITPQGIKMVFEGKEFSVNVNK